MIQSPVQGTHIKRVVFQARDGHSIHMWQWPYEPGRTTLHWAHATGFHGRMHAPLLDQLAAHFNVYAWDMRGHGTSRDAFDAYNFTGWECYYDDLGSWLEKQESRVILAGHSVGGTLSLITAGRNPDKVKALVLPEPVLMGRSARAYLAISKRFKFAHRFWLPAMARRRRPAFISRQAAFESYRGRGAFRTWKDEWLQAYVEHAFYDAGDEVRLHCDPVVESISFATTEHRPWSKIRRLHCPLIALGAEKESTFPLSSRKKLKRILPQAEITEIPGTTHFLPIERPDIVVDAIRSLD